MITGSNTDVEHEGRTYHVQTEDRGTSFPVIESLVYCGGEIVASRRRPYGELLAEGRYSDELVHGLMDEQHQRLIREIRNGKFDTDKLQPFGSSIVTNRSFDVVVLDYLEHQITVEQIQLRMTGPKTLRGGSTPTLKFEVLERNTGRPICGATVSVRLLGSGDGGTDLLSASTDERGHVEASFQLPQLDSEESLLVCHAEAASQTAEIRRPVQRPAGAASAGRA
jgi:hypothetical protein